MDFGANLAGVVQLIGVKCKSGDTITLHHGEILQHAGIPGLKDVDPKRVYYGNLRSAKATDVYTCRGDPGGETWHPRLTYHGFRFVEIQVSSPSIAIAKDNLRMLHFHSAVQQKSKVGRTFMNRNTRRHASMHTKHTGLLTHVHIQRNTCPKHIQVSFKSDTLNMIQKMALGAQRSNMMTVPTDCDQRDERLGWMGDENLSSESMGLNFNAASFLRNFVDAMVSEQGDDGSLPDTVPFARYGSRPGDVSWSTALPQTVHVLHANGDLTPDEVKDYMPALLGPGRGRAPSSRRASRR